MSLVVLIVYQWFVGIHNISMRNVQYTLTNSNIYIGSTDIWNDVFLITFIFKLGQVKVVCHSLTLN